MFGARYPTWKGVLAFFSRRSLQSKCGLAPTNAMEVLYLHHRGIQICLFDRYDQGESPNRPVKWMAMNVRKKTVNSMMAYPDNENKKHTKLKVVV
jgi:hypothetical protein